MNQLKFKINFVLFFLCSISEMKFIGPIIPILNSELNYEKYERCFTTKNKRII